MGLVTAVAASPGYTFSKPTRPSITLLAGLGVAGDAHNGATVKHRSRVRRDPTQPNLRQVHLIHEELHDELRAAGFDVGAGDLGENVTTRGVDLLALPAGTLLRLGGEAVVEVTGLRNPCVQLDAFQAGADRGGARPRRARRARPQGRGDERRPRGRRRAPGRRDRRRAPDRPAPPARGGLAGGHLRVARRPHLVPRLGRRRPHAAPMPPRRPRLDAPLLRAARAARGERRVVVYDQLGCGRSPADGDVEWSLGLFLEELDALRAHLGLDRVHLLGTSWGGMLALEHALARQETLATLILSSTLASAGSGRSR